MLAAFVHQRVLEHPAHAGGVRTQFGLGPGRQAALDLGEVFQDPAARPVDVGAVLEDDVDIGKAEIGETADGLDLGRSQQRRDDRVGDLVLDDVRAAVPLGVDDHLGVAQVRDGVQADVVQGVYGVERRRRPP